MEPHVLQSHRDLILINCYMVFTIILWAFSTWYYKTRKKNLGQMGKECFNGAVHQAEE